MSAASTFQPDYDFWEFASCGRCQLPFTTPAGATLPFWLTECGHIVCNTHLNANQSCSICGTPGIQLVPLQREMEAPMSEWFQSIPIGLDAIANSAKFQYETMASQIRHYRTRHQQLRVLVERLKTDIVDLKKHNELLSNENNRLHQQSGLKGYGDRGPEQPNSLNSNGKRPRTEVHPYEPHNHGLQSSTSSPHSNLTPAPSRLTLPQGQPITNLFNAATEKTDGPQINANFPPDSVGALESRHRPATGFIEKYAYVAPPTPQLRRQQHPRVPLQNFVRTTTVQDKSQAELQQLPPQHTVHRDMPPPSTPSRFKVPRVTVAPIHSTNQQPRQGRFQQAIRVYSGQQKTMGERSLEAIQEQQSGHFRTSQPNDQDTSKLSSKYNSATTVTGTNRFVPAAQHSEPSAAAVSNGHGPQRFIPPGSRAPSRSQNMNYVGGGQRTPFVPKQSQVGYG